MKLPAHRAGLPGNVISFYYIAPLPACLLQAGAGRDPAYPAMSGKGHLPVTALPGHVLASNSKSQITNSQFKMTKTILLETLNFVHSNLFVIWCLLFDVCS
jgi:hypothetical protein